MQVARNRYRGHRHLTRREVVTRRRRDHGFRRQLNAGVEVERLREVTRISRSTVIREACTIVEAIVESEVPRYREVIVLSRHPLPSHCGVELTIGVAPRVEVLGRERGDVVARNLVLILARTERIAEAPACRLQAADATAAPHQLVVAHTLG